MVLLLAFSLQDQVEKYGAYVGIAAFFGLAVLTLLYFSQAREVRRLREWAGRAPERAQELEARVAANAQAARGVQAVPRAATPAAAGVVAAATAAGQGAAQVAAPAETGDGKGPAEGEAAAEEQKAESGDGAAAEPVAEGPRTEGGAAPQPAVAPEAAKPEEAAAGAPGAAKPEEAAEAATPDGTPSAPVAEAEPAAIPAAQAANGVAPAEALDADDAHDDEEEAPAAATNGGPAGAGEVPIPRATPVPRRTPVPAAPLRQPARSATIPPRRTTAPPPRRGAPAPAADGSGRSWILPAVLGVVILGAVAFGATRLLGGDDSAPSTPGAQPSASPDAGATAPEPAQSAGGLTKETVRIAVLNGTTTAGLAATEADKLKAAGFTREIITGNNTDQQRSDSSVLYASGARTIAREVARRIDIARVEAIDPDTRSLGENAEVVVILGQDKAP